MNRPVFQESVLSGNVEVPCRGYWSTRYAKWQRPFAGLHSTGFAATVTVRELKRRRIDVTEFDHAVTIPQWRGFSGPPAHEHDWIGFCYGTHGGPGLPNGPALSRDGRIGSSERSSNRSLNVTCDLISNGAFRSNNDCQAWSCA